MRVSDHRFVLFCCASAIGSGCSFIGYWGRNVSVMQRETLRAPKPLARHVVWVMEEQLLDNQPNFYLTDEELPEEAAPHDFGRDVRATDSAQPRRSAAHLSFGQRGSAVAGLRGTSWRR